MKSLGPKFNCKVIPYVHIWLGAWRVGPWGAGALRPWGAKVLGSRGALEPCGKLGGL